VEPSSHTTVLDSAPGTAPPRLMNPPDRSYTSRPASRKATSSIRSFTVFIVQHNGFAKQFDRLIHAAYRGAIRMSSP
jgi:hypothetical protein